MTGRDAVVIREMTADDVSAVAELERQAAVDPWSESLFEAELSQADRCWLVAVVEDQTGVAADGKADGKRVVGFAGAMTVADDAHVMNIAVAPNRQGQGVARRLLTELLAVVAGHGARAATLEVRADNNAALHLYRRFGFEEAGRRPGYYSDGADGIIMWRYSLEPCRSVT